MQAFLIIALDCQDVVLTGDPALRKIIRRLYGMDHLPSQHEVLELAERWRPYRSLAPSYLFQAAYGASGWNLRVSVWVAQVSLRSRAVRSPRCGRRHHEPAKLAWQGCARR